MTAHVLTLLMWLLPVAVPQTPRPTDAEIFAEAQRRANQFCTPSYIYPTNAEPLIVQCTPLPDCDSVVLHDNPYSVRCTEKI